MSRSSYPTDTEVRVVDGDHGTRNDKEVTGGSLDAMKLQAARLALPLLLVEKRASLKDLGTKDGIRAIEIPLPGALTLTVDDRSEDVAHPPFVRQGSASSNSSSTTATSAAPGGLLFPFAEAGMAQGMPTANTKFDTIEINAPATPPPSKMSANCQTIRDLPPEVALTVEPMIVRSISEPPPVACVGKKVDPEGVAEQLKNRVERVLSTQALPGSTKRMWRIAGQCRVRFARSDH